MDTYLYGIPKWGYKVKVEKTKIVRETKKLFIVEEAIDAYGYKTHVNKGDKIAFTEKEAINIFIQQKEEKLNGQKTAIQHTKSLLDQARKLL